MKLINPKIMVNHLLHQGDIENVLFLQLNFQSFGKKEYCTVLHY